MYQQNSANSESEIVENLVELFKQLSNSKFLLNLSQILFCFCFVSHQTSSFLAISLIIYP